MNPRRTPNRMLLAALLAASTATLGCRDRGVPDDVPHARTGGIGRAPVVGQATGVGSGQRDDTGPAGGAGAGASGVSAGGFGGSAGIPGTGGTGGSAGIPGTGGFGGSAGIPGTGGTGGSAGIPGVEGVGGAAGIPGVEGVAGSAGIPGGDLGASDDATAGTGAAGALGIGGSLGGVGTNLSPVASFVASPPCISEIQTTVTLASSSVDPDGDPLRCSWVLPDATPNSSEDCMVTVTFFNAVESEVQLLVHGVTGTIARCPGT
jgi:hypothetical protein